MAWQDTLKSLAPTVLAGALGPAGAGIVAALGAIIGISEPTQDKIAKAFQSGQLTPQQITDIKMLEMKLKADEQERGFKYEELAFKDRDSARQANVQGGTQKWILALSVTILLIAFGTEIAILFWGYSTQIDAIVVGRILGLLDGAALMVLGYHYGSSHGSDNKTALLAAK